MRITLKLAWRNLGRNRRRSLLTLGAIFFPVMILILMWGMGNAVQRNLFESVTLLEIGHLQIHESGYKDLRNRSPLIDNAQPVLDTLASDPNVAWFTARLELPALAANGARSRGILLQGIEPDKAQAISLMDEWVREGRALLAEDRRAAVAGEALLERLNAQVGDNLIVVVTDPRSGTGALTPQIVGKVNPPSVELGSAIMQIPLADARALVNNRAAASSVVVLLEDVAGPWDQARIKAAARQLQERLGDGFIVETWDELAPEMAAMFNIIQPVYLAFSLVFFALGGLVVLNTVYLTVVERTRELGVMLALGSSRKRMMTLILAETLLLGGIGALAGVIVGGGLVGLGSSGFRLDYAGIGDIYLSFGINPLMHTSVTAGEILLSAGIMLLIAIAAAILPARKAARLEPIEAMRFVA